MPFVIDHEFSQIHADYRAFELKGHEVKFSNRTSGRVRIDFTKSEGGVLELLPFEEKTIGSPQLGIVMYNSLNIYFEVSTSQRLDIEVSVIREVEGNKFPSLDEKQLTSFDEATPTISQNSPDEDGDSGVIVP